MKVSPLALALAAISFACRAPTQDAPLDRGGEITVRVRVQDEHGNPLRGAGMVCGDPARTTSDSALRTPDAVSGDDGRITCSIPAGSTTFYGLRAVRIHAEGRAAWFAPVLWMMSTTYTGPHAVDLGDIRLPKAVTLTGRVRDENGKPLAGARVYSRDLLTTSTELGHYGACTVTDARGLFQLRGTFGQAVSLRVVADGYYQRKLSWAGAGIPLDFQLERSGFVEGTVTDSEGKPVAGAMTMMHEFHDGMGYSLQTFEGGRFRIPVIRPGRFRCVAHTDHGVATSDIFDGPRPNVALRLASDDKKHFVVKAVDARTKQAIPRFRASISPFGGAGNAWMEKLAIGNAQSSNASGRILISNAGMTPDAMLYVGADGYADAFVDNVDPTAGKQQIVELVSAGSIHGSCKAGALVKATWTEKLADQPLPKGVRPAIGAFETTCGVDGKFSLNGLAPGKYDVTASHGQRTIGTHTEVEVQSGKATDEVRIDLPAGATCRGRFTGDFRPGPGWRLLLRPNDNRKDQRSWQPWLVQPAKAWNEAGSVPIHDGTFERAHLEPGSYELALLAPSRPRSGTALLLPIRTIDVADQDVDLEIDATDHRPATILGQVRTVGIDAPAGRIAIVVKDLEDRASEQWQCTMLAPNGRYQLLAAAGNPDVVAVDTLTGIILARQTVQLAAGAREVVDFRLELATLWIRFEPAPKGLLPLQSVDVRRGEGPAYSVLGERGGQGIRYAGQFEDVEMLLTAGDFRLQLGTGASTITPGAVIFGGNELAPVPVSLKTGERATVKIPTPEAKPLDDGQR